MCRTLQVLALVLVQALDEHIEHRLGIDCDAEGAVDVGGELLLVVVLDVAPLPGKLRIFGHRFEAAQLFEVVNPAVTKARGEQCRRGEDCSAPSSVAASRHWSCC